MENNFCNDTTECKNLQMSIVKIYKRRSHIFVLAHTVSEILLKKFNFKKQVTVTEHNFRCDTYIYITMENVKIYK